MNFKVQQCIYKEPKFDVGNYVQKELTHNLAFELLKVHENDVEENVAHDTFTVYSLNLEVFSKSDFNGRLRELSDKLKSAGISDELHNEMIKIFLRK